MQNSYFSFNTQVSENASKNHLHNLKQNEAQSARAESTHKGGN